MELSYFDIRFDYSFSSLLGLEDNSRFIREHKLRMYLLDENEVRQEHIGTLDFMIVHIDHALYHDNPMPLILDCHSAYLAEHVFKIWDCENEDFRKCVRDHYDFAFTSPNLGFIKNIQISAAYRGYNIAAYALRDVIFHYGMAANLFALKPYPLQFADEKWLDPNLNLKLSHLEPDREKAVAKLKRYFAYYGFEEIEDVPDLMLLNNALINDELFHLIPDEFEIPILK